MRIILRIFLLLAYLALSFVAIWFFNSFGEPTPSAIILSWGVALAKLFWGTLWGLIALSLLYYMALFLITTWMAPRSKFAFPFVPAAIQGLGCLLVLLTKGSGPKSDYPYVGGFGYLAGAALVLSYLWIDWAMARTMKKTIASSPP